MVSLNQSCFRASLGDNDTIHHIQFDNPEEESYCDRYFYETQVTVERNLYAALILESSGTNMTISVERHGESLSKSHNWFHDRDNGIIYLILVSLFIQYLVIIIIDRTPFGNFKLSTFCRSYFFSKFQHEILASIKA